MQYTTQDSRWPLLGDGVSTYFHLVEGKLILAEDYYFHLMASMRKMRMRIPLQWTLEFFTDLVGTFAQEKQISTGTLHLTAYRPVVESTLYQSPIELNIRRVPDSTAAITKIRPAIEIDVLKDITVNTSLLSVLFTASAENIYATAYLQDNDLDDVLLLNPQRRVARSVYGNILLLKDKAVVVPKTTEGAYISPLAESFITFLHKQNYTTISPEEVAPYLTQQSQEILIVSDEKGIFPVRQIRNKDFEHFQFAQWLGEWENHLLHT